MNRWAFRNRAAVCALAMSVCGTFARATDGTHDFARYKIILDRAPFGAMSGVTPEAQQPGFSTRFTFIGTAKLDDNQPLMAIILDKEGNHVHFKAEGESIGPVSIVKIEKADKGPAKLVLKQGLEVATLLMESKAASGGPPITFAPPPQPGQPPIAPNPDLGARRIPFARGAGR